MKLLVRLVDFADFPFELPNFLFGSLTRAVPCRQKQLANHLLWPKITLAWHSFGTHRLISQESHACNSKNTVIEYVVYHWTMVSFISYSCLMIRCVHRPLAQAQHLLHLHINLLLHLHHFGEMGQLLDLVRLVGLACPNVGPTRCVMENGRWKGSPCGFR